MRWFPKIFLMWKANIYLFMNTIAISADKKLRKPYKRCFLLSVLHPHEISRLKYMFLLQITMAKYVTMISPVMLMQ